MKIPENKNMTVNCNLLTAYLYGFCYFYFIFCCVIK